jgi:hypothetical protein
MALVDIEAELIDDTPWRTCSVCHHLSLRDDEWAASLRRLLANPAVKFRHLASKMAQDPDEPTIPWEALSRHARAGCSAKEHLR